MATKKKRKVPKATKAEPKNKRIVALNSLRERTEHVLVNLVAMKDELEQLRSDAFNADLPGTSGAFALIVESLGNINQTLDDQICDIQVSLGVA